MHKTTLLCLLSLCVLLPACADVPSNTGSPGMGRYNAEKAQSELSRDADKIKN